MYEKENGFSAVARTSNLNEELEQVEYYFLVKQVLVLVKQKKLKN
jgi:hypothetical protein